MKRGRADTDTVRFLRRVYLYQERVFGGGEGGIRTVAWGLFTQAREGCTFTKNHRKKVQRTPTRLLRLMWYGCN